MAKLSQNARAQERPAKKARIGAPPRGIIPTKKKPAPLTKPAKAVEKSEVLAPIPSSLKGKGKETEQPKPSITKKTKKRKARESDDVLPSSFKVVAGSYEKLLYGLDGTVTVDDHSNLQFHLKPIFIFPAHVSCIKAVAASPHGGKWLATGSADEIVKVWDLRRRKEIGGLMHHEGSITHLTFPSRSHLLSASEDGTLCLFRARDWAVLRVLKGHKGRVNSVAVHPSGKVALSVGKDRALRMWDLMRGKGCASTKLGKEGELVRWSIDGAKFVVQSGSTLDIYSTTMDLLYTIKHPARLHDVNFCKRIDGTGELLLAGGEDHKLSVYSLPPKDDPSSPIVVAELIGHTNRIKAVQTIELALPASSDRKSTIIACTVSSDGYVNIYDMAPVPEHPSESQKPVQIEPSTTYDSKGTRLTCVTLAEGGEEVGVGPLEGKRKRADDEENDEEDEQDEGDSADEDDFGAGWENGEEEEEEEVEEEEEEVEEESD
ncbi:WD40-repeat-containing domain protein [Crassisporium funariophilum]|nr:WD40-repeat-containing domain protein [Crassisporium funariophilum]